MSNFPCANCGTPSITLFEGTPLCGSCNEVVVHLLDKTDAELRALRRLRVEAIRLKIIEAKLPRKHAQQTDPSLHPARQ